LVALAKAKAFPRLETIKIIIVKIIKRDCKKITIKENFSKKTNRIKKNKMDLMSTWYLKTAIIEKEYKTKLINDIFEG
tara:strand:+ start:120 stop:353 length:234 start_codon:yes stop_codon:yes gene_type:complete